MTLHKHYVTDENQQPIAVQIPIEEFNRLEEILEDAGLLKMIEEVQNDEVLSSEEGWKYYDSLPKTS
jgi:hypothetical protein